MGTIGRDRAVAVAASGSGCWMQAPSRHRPDGMVAPPPAGPCHWLDHPVHILRRIFESGRRQVRTRWPVRHIASPGTRAFRRRQECDATHNRDHQGTMTTSSMTLVRAADCSCGAASSVLASVIQRSPILPGCAAGRHPFRPQLPCGRQGVAGGSNRAGERISCPHPAGPR